MKTFRMNVLGVEERCQGRNRWEVIKTQDLVAGAEIRNHAMAGADQKSALEAIKRGGPGLYDISKQKDPNNPKLGWRVLNAVRVGAVSSPAAAASGKTPSPASSAQQAAKPAPAQLPTQRSAAEIRAEIGARAAQAAAVIIGAAIANGEFSSDAGGITAAGNAAVKLTRRLADEVVAWSQNKPATMESTPRKEGTA